MIRKGTVNDVRKVARLWLQMVEELVPGATPNAEWWRQCAFNALRGNVYFLFVIERGGALLGFLDFFVLAEPFTGKVHAIARHLYVLPEHRNGPAARELYHVSMRAARAQGAQVIDLFCKEAQVPFWGKRGYVVGEFKMSKVL
jgi:GNAT superfamily N-acetyltransferase